MNQMIDIYIYTGTGNTLIIAKEIQQEFSLYGYTVNLVPLEKIKPSSINPNHINGFGFPIAVHTTYPFILEILETIPWNSTMKVFFFNTLGGTKCGMDNYLSKLHKKYKFSFLGNGSFQMPNNLFTIDMKEEGNQDLIKESRLTVKKFVWNLLNEQNYSFQTDFLSFLFNPFSQSDFTWNMLKKVYHLQVDQEECINCGICEYICPIGNIVYNYENKLYEHKNHCEICLRCLSYCPKNAISIKGKENRVKYLGISQKEMLSWCGIHLKHS